MDLEELATEIKTVGLRRFINTHRLELCRTTVNQLQTAQALKLDTDQQAEIMHPETPFGKCAKLYEYIEKKATPLTLLQALQNSGNEVVVDFIRSKFPNLTQVQVQAQPVQVVAPIARQPQLQLQKHLQRQDSTSSDDSPLR